MNPQQPYDGDADDALQNVDNPLKVMQPGERVICEIKRHPFGLISLYLSFGFVVVVAITAVVIAPQLITGLSSQAQAAIALGGVILSALVGFFTYISSIVYKGNRWIVTTDSITQISQISLFRKQTSQLSLANLEDVTVEQDGILQSMFGFGRLKAESAGQRSKFVFDFCPDPSKHAKMIIAAHEAYIAERPEEMRTTNRPLANTTSFNQPYGPPQYDPTQPGQSGLGPQGQYNPVQQPYKQQASAPPQPYDPTQPNGQQPANTQWPQNPGSPTSGQ